MSDTYEEFRKIRDLENKRLETMSWDEYVRGVKERTDGLAEQMRQKIAHNAEEKQLSESSPAQ